MWKTLQSSIDVSDFEEASQLKLCLSTTRRTVIVERNILCSKTSWWLRKVDGKIAKAGSVRWGEWYVSCFACVSECDVESSRVGYFDVAEAACVE